MEYQGEDTIPHFSCIIKVSDTSRACSSTSKSPEKYSQACKRVSSVSSPSFIKIKAADVYQKSEGNCYRSDELSEYKNQQTSKIRGRDIYQSLRLKFKDWNVQNLIPKENGPLTVEYSDKYTDLAPICFLNKNKQRELRSKSNQKSSRSFQNATMVINSSINNHGVGTKSLTSSRTRLEPAQSRGKIIIEPKKRVIQNASHKMKIINNVRLIKCIRQKIITNEIKIKESRL
ncbi:unnamed protein product [Moneuplotes crassus]|uniref:Uncharacterized protein n=1 Tax=Euplotes crassus TaxID=5936 RepID=A0AAD2CZA0_EUPCR|nr:unnamed protein product [Moneuplotes crassus]